MIYFVTRIPDLFDWEESSIQECSLVNVCEWLDTHFTFGCDTETEGMMNFNNKVIMLQIGDADTQFVIDCRGLDISVLRKYFESNEWLKIFHNAKFDVNFLRFTFGWRTKRVYDTFLAECCLTNGIKGRSLGLAALTAKYCRGAILDKSERGRFVGLGSKPYTHSNIVYGARDVEYLLCIKDSQQSDIVMKKVEDVVQLECEVVLALCDIEYNGMQLDVDKWIELASKAENKMKQLEEELDSMVTLDPKLVAFRKEYVQQDMFGGYIKPTTIKWTSPIQVLEILKLLGVTEESSSEKEILKYQNKIPLVKKFLDYKHEQKLTTTYGEDFLSYINKRTGRIHTSFWQILDTHRVSSSEPNLQQIPARKEYLACFTAPRGYKIVGADFAQQELRLVAQGSQDPLWIEILNDPSRDLHGEIAAKLFGILLTEVKQRPDFVFVGGTKVYLRGKSPRDVTKTINFMLIYGGSAYKLSDTLGITVEEAEVIIEGYFRLVPKVKEFLEKCAKYGLKHLHMKSFKPYSVLRQFHNKDLRDNKIRGEIERASKNTIIQATGAMMCKLALVKLKEKIEEVPYKVEMFLQVHDAIFCYVEEEYAEEWSVIQKEVMEEAGRVWLHSVPCISDVSIHDYWSK